MINPIRAQIGPNKTTRSGGSGTTNGLKTPKINPDNPALTPDAIQSG